jgi:uncharacterized membrane protein
MPVSHTNVDLIFTELRSGLSTEAKVKLNFIRFRSIFISTLLMSGYVCFGIIESLILPQINKPLNSQAFRENILITSIFILIFCLVLSFIVAFATTKSSKEFLNKDPVELQSHLDEIRCRVERAEFLANKINSTSAEIAESYLKEQIDLLNDKISIFTLLSLIGTFLAGALSFIEINDIGSRLITAILIWIILFLRLQSLGRLFVLREWLTVISIMKIILKNHKNE